MSPFRQCTLDEYNRLKTSDSRPLTIWLLRH